MKKESARRESQRERKKGESEWIRKDEKEVVLPSNPLELFG